MFPPPPTPGAPFLAAPFSQ